jgi:hypothetical protein
LNLIDNAVKYASEGKEVDVRLTRVPGGVALSVRDFGPGIPAAEQPRIFERFYRAQGARDRNVRGSGIGLALVKHIVQAHGGRLAVQSQPGEGAAFTVVLPAAPVLVQAGGDEAATSTTAQGPETAAEPWSPEPAEAAGAVAVTTVAAVAAVAVGERRRAAPRGPAGER